MSRLSAPCVGALDPMLASRFGLAPSYVPEDVAKRAVRFLNRQDGSVSRAGLSAALGITAAQCSEVVSYLADSGMIGEAADGIRLSAFAADALRVFDLA